MEITFQNSKIASGLVGKPIENNNVADAICIAFYVLHEGSKCGKKVKLI